MVEFPGFPSNDFDFHFEEAGGALAGLLMRTRSGDVVPGVLASSDTLLQAGDGWTVRVAPFVAARSKGRSVLLGGSTDEVLLDISPAPAANARIDVVYSLPADVGAGDPVRAVGVAKGVAGAVPVKPSIPLGAIELGTVRVAAGNSSVAAATITETFKFAGLVGGELRVRRAADLAALDVIDGTLAYIVETGGGAARVGGAWLVSKRVAYTSPFSAFSAGQPDVTVDIIGGQVVVAGTFTTSKPAELAGNEGRVVASIGAEYAPSQAIPLITQGSDMNRMLLTLGTNGVITAARYAPGNPPARPWGPFFFSYPLKRR